MMRNCGDVDDEHAYAHGYDDAGDDEQTMTVDDASDDV